MASALRVLTRMTVGRAVAASDLATREADPQVAPLATGSQALLAALDGLGELCDVDLIEMGAFGHRSVLSSHADSSPIEHRSVVEPSSQQEGALGRSTPS